MPRDQRLYMTFPIDFDEHPKVAARTDAAFRAFVEMNAYCRRNSTDGVIDVVYANRRWKMRVMNELVNSHPERPLVILDGDRYVIRDYAEHQLTTDAIEDLRQKRSEAGRQGANAKASAQALAKQGAKANRKQSLESRDLEGQTDGRDSHKPVTLVTARDSDNGDGEFEFAVEEAASLGVKSLTRVRDAFDHVIDADLTWADAVDLTRAVLELSTTHVRYVEAYVEKACTNSPGQVRDAWASIPHPGGAT